MKNTKSEYIEMIYNKVIPNEKLKWKLAPTNNKYKFFNGEICLSKKDVLYKTKLYNRKNKNKIYCIEIYLLYSKHRGYETLYFSGYLSNWYYQVELGRDLSLEEYDKCLSFLLSEIGVSRMDDDDMEESLDSDEFEYTYYCIQDHEAFMDKKRNKRISKIKTT
ncbi:hypothetical protein [Flavobacterium ajazii]|uniref:hypothetical protein n=1 Tax=Flavobacterium ajazii TaxID=2692318 RepID=UPI0013D20114|nr:hypothetical protein [Flavobacterium ajazii]